jgi:competence protein ComEC
LLKLRKILLYDRVYLILTCCILVYSLLITNFEHRKSIYKGNEKSLYGDIKNLKIDGDKLQVELSTPEAIIGSYYINSFTEKKYIIKNYKLGDYLKIKGSMQRPKNNTVFNLFDYKKYLNHNNIFYLFKIDSLVKIKNNNKISLKLRQAIDDRINNINYSKDYLKAFIIGDTSAISNDVKSSYQINGISHLLAISGAQVSLFAIILLFMFKIIRIEENKRYYLTMLFIMLYMYLTNYNASVVRASIFFMLLSINKLYYFNVKTINILLMALVIILLLNPYFIYDIGFQLSFIISLYLIIFQPIIKEYNNYITKLLIISFIAFLSSMPIVINNFFQINLLSIANNLIFVPLVSLIIYPLALITFIFPIFDKPLYILITVMEFLSLIISKVTIFNIILCKPNIFTMIIYYITISFCLIKFKQKKTYMLLIVALLICHHILPYINNIAKIVMIDVNQGDSILIVLPHNKGNILIDTGGKLQYQKDKWQQSKNKYSIAFNTLVPYFKSLGITKLDYLILTHGDADHMGESINLISNFNVKNIILNNGSKNYLEKALVNKAKDIPIYFYNKKILNIKGYPFYFINNAKGLNINDNSLVIYTVINNKKILLTGDITTNKENKIIEEYNLNNIDILKIAHHGSATSTSNEFLDEINPKYALISVALKNTFNHPSPLVIKRLKTRNIKTYLTSTNGSVMFNLLNNNVTIKYSKP